MIGIRSFFINGILLAAATNITNLEPEGTFNSVKSALATVLELNHTDNAGNIKFLDRVQRVIGKMKDVFEQNHNNVRRTSYSVKHEKFTNFIQNVINYVNKYDNGDLEDFFAILNDEIRKYHYRGCKFHELTENYAFRTFLSGLFNEIKIQPAEVIRIKLEAVANKMKMEQYDKNESDLIDVINSLYRQDFDETFQNILMNIDAYRLKTRKNIDLVKIVKDGLRSVIFDYYSNLNPNARRALKLQINEYWNNLSQQLPLKDFDYTVTVYPITATKKIEVITKVTTKRRIFRHEDEHIIADQTAFIKNDNKSFVRKSLYLPSSPTTSKPNKMDSIKLGNMKYLSTRQIIKYGEKIVYRNNRNRTDKSDRTTYFPSRTTRRLITAKYLHREKNLDLKFETDAYEYLTTEARRKKLTFKTLYPEFVSEWTWSRPLVGRTKLSRRAPEKNIQYICQNADSERDRPQRPKHIKAIRLVKELGATFEVGMKISPMPRSRNKFEMSKHRPTTRKLKMVTYIPRILEAKEVSARPIGLKKRPSKYNKITTRRWNFLSADSSTNFNKRKGNFGKSKTRNSMVSLESLSMEEFNKVEQKYAYRRSEKNNNATKNGHPTVSNGLFQVQQPESQRQLIETPLYNNTKILKSFSHEVQVTEENDQNTHEKEKNDENSKNSELPDSRKVKYSIKNNSNSDKLLGINDGHNDFDVNRPTHKDSQLKHYEQNNIEINEFNDNMHNENESNFEPNQYNLDKVNLRKAAGLKKDVEEDEINYDKYSKEKKQGRKGLTNDDIALFDIVNKNVTNTEKNTTAEIAANKATTTTVTLKPISSLHTESVTNTQITSENVTSFVYAEILDNMKNVTTKQTTVRNSKLMAQHVNKKGSIEYSAEELRKEVANSADVNFKPETNYKDTPDIGNHKNKNDLVADEFPEFIDTLGESAPRL